MKLTYKGRVAKSYPTLGFTASPGQTVDVPNEHVDSLLSRGWVKAQDKPAKETKGEDK